jgi:hypothetical protein
MDKYHVVVTRLHVASWEWEIYRNSEPLPVRMRDGPYKSVRTAESVGSVALREFLQALNREKSLTVNPRPLLGRPPAPASALGRARQRAVMGCPYHQKATGKRRNDVAGHRSQVEQAGHPDPEQKRTVAAGAGPAGVGADLMRRADAPRPEVSPNSSGRSSRPEPAKAGSEPRYAACGSGGRSSFPLISAARRSNG